MSVGMSEDSRIERQKLGVADQKIAELEAKIAGLKEKCTIKDEIIALLEGEIAVLNEFLVAERTFGSEGG
jgi:hypothetical protein